jgi:hypothetical protein
MDICEERHEPIVYDGGDCPLCDSIKTLEEAKEAVEDFVTAHDQLVQDIKNKFEEARETGHAVSDLYLLDKVEKFNVSPLENISWD